ncbi:MAG: class I SAM-dependent methyltransferase [Phenylobacterium sp.]
MEDSVYLEMAAVEARHWWFKGRRRILESEIGRRLPLAPPGGRRILEVGSGTGGNLELLQTFGSVDAVEPNAMARELAARSECARLHDGGLPDQMPDFAEGFDLIAAFDVIEHVEADAASIRTLAGLLRPEGLLAVTVPAFGALWSRHDERHHHKRRYSRRDLEALFRQPGLEIVRLTYFNTLLFPVAASVRLAERAGLIESAGADRLPPPALNAILARVFGAEAGLLRFLSPPFGLSLLLIARKTGVHGE